MSGERHPGIPPAAPGEAPGGVAAGARARERGLAGTVRRPGPRAGTRWPPPWVWALPAAAGAGLLLGLCLRAVPAGPSPPGIAAARPVPPPALTPQPGASRPVPPRAPTPETVRWEAGDGGDYHPITDTLPAAPHVVTAPEAGEAGEAGGDPGLRGEDPPGPEPRPADGPAQGLSREAALARPLVAAARGRQMAYYSAWDAPAARASLVGEWAEAGTCRGVVRLRYEQAVPGLGGVRGAGEAEERPGWDLALVVPRQHCAAAAPRWRRPRVPRPQERALLAPHLGGEPPRMVLTEGGLVLAASAHRAAVVRFAGGRAVPVWSAVAPEGASMWLLGRWDGDGVWAARTPGGRVVRLWRTGE